MGTKVGELEREREERKEGRGKDEQNIKGNMFCFYSSMIFSVFSLTFLILSYILTLSSFIINLNCLIQCIVYCIFLFSLNIIFSCTLFNKFFFLFFILSLKTIKLFCIVLFSSFRHFYICYIFFLSLRFPFFFSPVSFKII